MAYTKKNQLFRLMFFLIPGGAKRSKVIMKRKIFKETGNKIKWQPRTLPADPELIKLHNNISVASGVTFITHDVFRLIFNQMGYKYNFGKHLGCIEVMDNVAIGAKAIILPNVKIGPNAIVGAGPIVTKDVPEGAIVAGNPAKVIGSFDELVLRRMNQDQKLDSSEIAWTYFNKRR